MITALLKKLRPENLIKLNPKYIPLFLVIFIFILSFAFLWQTTSFSLREKNLNIKLAGTKKDLDKSIAELTALKKEDQYVKNKALEAQIGEIEKTYKDTVKTFEDLLALKEQPNKTGKMDEKFAAILDLLSKRNYASASANLKMLSDEIQKTKDDIASSFTIPQNVTVNNSPPASGYRRQSVETDAGMFMVDIISADLNSARVIVDTAANGDCANNCPTEALASFAQRSGAFAGINGPYFCPAEYPSCAGKTNSFDTLLMNKNKVYFNGANNVYSTVPAVIFSGSSARWVGRSLEWGRDTGVDSVIAMWPLLTSGGQIVFSGNDVAKQSGKGNRSFIGTTGNTVYIGVVHNATVAEQAKVMKALGIDNSMHLDDGGSTALWSGGYIDGPGRNTPFGILFVRK